MSNVSNIICNQRYTVSKLGKTQELGSIIFMGPFQLTTIYNSMNHYGF